MLEQIVRPYIPVNSFVREPAIVTETPPEPDIGIRWGKPSRFEHSNQGKKSSQPRPRYVWERSDDDDDDKKLNELAQVVNFRGKAFKYSIKEDDGSVIQMVDKMMFDGTRIIQRYDEETKRRQMPGAMNIRYVFDLKFNEEG